MSHFTDMQIELVEKIMAGHCSKEEAHKEIKRIEAENPNEYPSLYRPERKEKPWDLVYLKELEDLFYRGANSKEFIEYMAEVSEEVYRAKRSRKLILSVLIALAGIAVIAILGKTILGK